MATAYEGGTGGKFRKNPLRRGGTPYDRPLNLRSPNEVERNGWFSRLVDPASRIVTTSATRLFSSVFRNRIPPALPAVSETNLESRNECPEGGSITPSGAQELGNNEGDKPTNSSESTGINDLEQLLKQKTFTRDEIDRLTELLRSRTVDITPGNEKTRIEPSTSQRAAGHESLENANFTIQENGMGSSRLFGSVSTPDVILRRVGHISEADIASPAELAKAYMGSRPSKVSPSTSGLLNRTFREDGTSLSYGSFAPSSPNVSLASRSSVRLSSVSRLSENGHLTHKPRGRSAMYNMARSPYSGCNSTAILKGITPSGEGCVGASTSSQQERANNILSGGKQVLKRRSSITDTDYGSVGPSRRIRQKSNIVSPYKDVNLLVHGSHFSTSMAATGSDSVQGSIASTQKPLLLEAAKNGDNGISSASFPSVPPKSSQTAQRILQQLDKIIPSAKERSFEMNLAIAMEKSPSKLMANPLHSQALRSTEDIHSLKLNIVRGSGTLDDLSSTQLLGPKITSKRVDRVEENGPTKAADAGVKLASVDGDVENAIISVGDTLSGARAANSTMSNITANSSRNKLVFQTSASVDNGSYNSKNSSAPLTCEKGKLKSPMLEPKAVVAETVIVDEPPESSSKRQFTAGFTLNKGINTRSDGANVTEKVSGSTFPVAPALITLSETKEQTAAAAPIFSFGSNSVDKAPTFTFSSSILGLSHTPGAKFGAALGSKSEQSAAPVFSFGSKSVDKAPVFTFTSSTGLSDPTSVKFDARLDKNPEQTVSAVFSFGSKSVKSNPTSTFSSSTAGASDHACLKFTGRFDSQPPVLSSISTVSMMKPATLLETTDSDKGNQTQKAANIFRSSENAVSMSVVASTTPNHFSVSYTNSNLTSDFVTSTSPTYSVPSTFPSVPLFGTSTRLISFSSSVGSTNGGNSPSISAAPLTFPPSISHFGSKTSAAVAASNSVLPPTSAFELKDYGPKTGKPSPFTITGSSLPASSFEVTSAGSTNFGSGSLALSTTTNTSAGSLLGTTASPTGSEIMSFTPSTQSQFSSFSTSSPAFGLSSSFSSSSSPFVPPIQGAKLFGSGSFASASSSFSTSFGFSSQPAKSSILGSGFGSTSSPATESSFGIPSAAAALPTNPLLGNSCLVTGFDSSSPGNDQMNFVDSMAEDAVTVTTPVVLAFGQTANSTPSSNFVFGSPSVLPGGMSPVSQFNAHQNLVTPQIPATSTIGSSLEGSFSLGSGGGDKSGRRFVRVKRDKNRKK